MDRACLFTATPVGAGSEPGLWLEGGVSKLLTIDNTN